MRIAAFIKRIAASSRPLLQARTPVPARLVPRISLLPALVLMVIGITGCRRDHLYYSSSETATVLVRPDWQPSGLNPNGVTVFAYRESDGSLYRRFAPVSASRDCYIKLPEGDFTLVIMNDTPEEFGGRIDFVGTENLSTLQARGIQDLRRSEVFADYFIYEPDSLAVSVVNGLHISPEQIDYFYDRPTTDISESSAIVVDAAPASVISGVNIKVHVKGLKYARGATSSYLRGVAAGTMIGLGVNSLEQVSQAFTLNNATYDPGSTSDGTIRANFLSFGLVGDGKTGARYYLDINFVLINGQPYPMSIDVTDLISIDITLNLSLSLNLELEIELPEVVGDEGGGFNTDIKEWDDELVEIPM